MRLGLCCQFTDYPVKFRTTTAAAVTKLERDAALARIDDICLHNAHALQQALDICNGLGIRAFRIGSGIWPLYTHPELGYRIDELPNGAEMLSIMKTAGKFARTHGIRLSFHPDQYTVLSSPRPEVVTSSIRDLLYMAELAELVGADVINIHGGGVYGDKPAALARLAETISSLPKKVRTRLTLENDDVSYTPIDLLPICNALGIPLVYDVHHHRCLPDGLSVAEATEAALETWQREPHFHISSPRDRTAGTNQRPHADYIAPEDFPTGWLDLNITVDVEAKAKEAAVIQLARELDRGIMP